MNGGTFEDENEGGGSLKCYNEEAEQAENSPERKDREDPILKQNALIRTNVRPGAWRVEHKGI